MMDGMALVEPSRGEAEVQLEVLRLAQKKLEAQHQSGERLRARLASTVQQATTLAAAAVAGWGALTATTGRPAAFEWALGSAFLFWLAAALFGFQHLRPRMWYDPGLRPSRIREDSERLRLPPAKFYEEISDVLEIHIAENDATMRNLAARLDVVLTLTTAAVPFALCVGLLAWIAGTMPLMASSGIAIALIAFAWALHNHRRSRQMQRGTKELGSLQQTRVLC